MEHANQWGPDLIGVTTVQLSGGGVEVWIAGPGPGPEHAPVLLTGDGRPTTFEAQHAAGAIIGLPLHRNLWWSLTLPPPAEGTDQIPFGVQVGDARCYGLARVHPPTPRPVELDQVEPMPAPKRKRGRPRKAVRSVDDV